MTGTRLPPGGSRTAPPGTLERRVRMAGGVRPVRYYKETGRRTHHVPAEPMSSILPDTPSFETPVYGTVFGQRALVLQRLKEGDQLILVPDPPGVEEPSVWVHAPGGDVVGHLSPDVTRWLAPRMIEGARYGARVRSIGRPGTESWKRLVISVRRS
jgi:hypothetical protein